MTPSGMVHALDETRRLLKADGCLIDVHPFAEASLFKVHSGKEILFSQPKPDFCKDDYLNADHVIEDAVRQKKYLLEGSVEFEYIILGASVSELRAYYEMIDTYESSPESAEITPLEAQLFEQAEEIRQGAGMGAEVAVHTRVHISRLKPAR
jgi:hypothetical protein